MAGTSDGSFKIGFALSGAISAGAYTAGVLDYFFQALDEWEKAKQQNAATTPQGQVVVQVVAGASAGAITGALGIVALARGIRPEMLSDAEKTNTYPTDTGTMQDIRCVLPALYETWVERPRMVGQDFGTAFLSGEDLPKKGDAQVVSALNSVLLDQIKDNALRAPPPEWPAPRARPPYPYVADNVHVYMTVSNLRGVPFTVNFANASYYMQTHGDRGHYVITDLGRGDSADKDNKWLCNDTTHAVKLKTSSLPSDDQKIPDDWGFYGTCALASSAFPVGLAPRRISAPIASYKLRSYPIQRGDATIEPSFPPEWEAKLGPDGYVFLNVDGGVINNNPFDYAQYALMGDYTADGKAETASRAVIMVSPFPEPPTFLPDGQPRDELVAVLRALFPALINQARFKPAELVPALNPDDHSRFLIAPHRIVKGADGKEREQKYKIACGLLGGFGGFLDERFRAHDFQLGRRNCQRFLERTFALPGTNRRMDGLPDGNRQDYETKPGAGKYRIVPRLGDALPEVPLPKWPRMRQSDFDWLMTQIGARLDRVGWHLVKAQTGNLVLRAIGGVGLYWGKNTVVNYVRFAILSDLVRRDQIEGWELPAMTGAPSQPDERQEFDDNVREVLAALASPAYTYRTADGIAGTTHLKPDFVRNVLADLERSAEDKPYRLWRGTAADGREIFALASRTGGFWMRQRERFIEPPTIG